MNFIKQLFVGIILASTIFAAAYFGLPYYSPNFDIMTTFQTYQTYILFLYISLIAIYILFTLHGRISRILLIIIILTNFIRLTSFFTERILGLSSTEFYILISLLILALLTAYLARWIRYILIIIITIPFAIILLNHTLPLYDTAPDFAGFYATQHTTLTIQSSDTDELLKTAESTIILNDKKILITNGRTTQPIDITSGLQISFSTKTGLTDTYAYIIFPNGIITTIYPQSAIKFTPCETYLSPCTFAPFALDLQTTQGQTDTYIPDILSGNLRSEFGVLNIESGNLSTLITNYNIQRNNYLIQQIGGEFMLNAKMDSFIRRYLNITNSIYSLISQIKFFGFQLQAPSFTLNILNYIEFHKYLPYQQSPNLGSKTADTNMIINDTNEGINQTKTKQRFDSIKNLFN